MEYDLNDSSLKNSNRYLWDKILINKIFKTLNDFKNGGNHAALERKFTILLIELKMAHDEFLENVRDLPMVMSCRTKGNSNSKFGGEQCAKFANSFCRACDKYLNSLNKEKFEEKSLESLILELRDKAKHDEKIAWDFEKETKKEYLITGKDNSLEILKSSGYEF